LSFERQIFIKLDEFENKPTSFIVNHDDIAYRILINEDTVTCFHCKQKGHISNQCPNLNTTTAESSITPLKKNINDNMAVETSSSESSEAIAIINSITLPSQGVKRPPPYSPTLSYSIPSTDIAPNMSFNLTTLDINENENIDWVVQKSKRSQKKRERTPSFEHCIANINKNLKPSENFFMNKERGISYIQFKDMIVNSQENKNVVETALQYCDIKSATEIIDKVNMTFITDCSLKIRLGKLSKTLKNHLQKPN